MTFPWSHVSLPSSNSLIWLQGEEGEKKLLLQDCWTLNTRSRSVSGKSYAPMKNCRTWALVITAYLPHWSLPLHHIPCGNDFHAPAITDFLLAAAENRCLWCHWLMLFVCDFLVEQGTVGSLYTFNVRLMSFIMVYRKIFWTNFCINQPTWTPKRNFRQLSVCKTIFY